MKCLLDRAREMYWTVCWKLAMLMFGKSAPESLWCEDRWVEAWWRQRKQCAERGRP